MKHGFSLLEIIITLGFLAILLVPITQLFISQDTEAVVQQTEIQALQAAAGLMEEINQRAFEDPNSLPDVSTASFGLRDDVHEITENRTTWDDIDDYHQLTVTTNGITLNVSVAYGLDVTSNLTRSTATTENSTDFKRVSVNARFESGYQLELIRVFANFYNP